MKKLENYTVIEILEMYREVIGKDIEDIIYSTFYQEARENNAIKQRIDEQTRKTASLGKIDRADMAYKLIKYELSRNEQINNQKNAKLIILFEIYRRFSSKMVAKEEKKLKELILGDDDFSVYQYLHDSTKLDNIKENEPSLVYKYEIITRDKKEKITSIHNETSRDVITRSINDILDINDISVALKKEYSGSVYENIRHNIMVKLLIEEKRMSPREFNKNLKQDNFMQLLENPDIRKRYEELLKEFLMNNLQFVDKTALLLNSAARVILGIRTAVGEEIDGVTLKDNSVASSEAIMQASIGFLNDISREISKQPDGESREYTIYSTDRYEPIIVTSKEYIESILSRCTKNSYLSEEEIKIIHEQIEDGILIDDFEKRKIAKIGLEDLINTCKSYETKEDNEDKKRLLQCGVEIVDYLKEIESITDKQLLELYLNGELSFELISNIEMNEISSDDYFTKFKELYFTMTFFSNTENEAEEFEKLSKFSKLYKHLKDKEKVSIDEEQIIEELISSYDIKYAPEILSDLYGLEVITLEKGLEWVGADIFIEEYKKGRLKPQEVRQFYEKDKNFMELARIINKLSDNGEKFMVIGSIFPEETEEDREIRDLLFDECLKLENNNEKSKSKNSRNIGNGRQNDYYKHITDPFARISLIKALDKDYSFEMTDDGHAIVKLPNFGKIIIEKMLDKNRDPSYGAATYILDDEYYEYNRFRIKKDGKINRQEIIKDIDTKDVTRIIHSVKTWGTDIKDYFLQTKKIKWTEEQETIIDESIKRVKRSDPMIKDNQQLAKMILNLVVTRKATIEQIEKIAEIYDVDLGKVMNSLDER